jgi:acyl-CoA reductase-like NAD-dependent aldehyde dehydrogenase
VFTISSPQKVSVAVQETWRQMLKSIATRLSQNAEEIMSLSTSEDVGNTFVDILATVLHEQSAYGEVYQGAIDALDLK